MNKGFIHLLKKTYIKVIFHQLNNENFLLCVTYTRVLVISDLYIL